MSDVNSVYAKMYTHSSNGGESKMGHIKFKETDNGLKMMVDLKDLRPGVQYNVKLYQCDMCYNDAKCCNNSKKMNINCHIILRIYMYNIVNANLKRSSITVYKIKPIILAISNIPI